MATKKVLVESSSRLMVSHAQLSELHRQFADCSLNGRHLQAFLRHEDPFNLDSIQINWAKVYELLGMKAEFEKNKASFAIEEDSDFWYIPVILGATVVKVIEVFKKIRVKIDCSPKDAGNSITKDERDPGKIGTYLVSLQKTIEADLGTQDLSTSVLIGKDIKGITVLERLLLGLGYFLATRKHLDRRSITLCGGSRYLDGSIPMVQFLDSCTEIYIRSIPSSCELPSGICTRDVVLEYP